MPPGSDCRTQDVSGRTRHHVGRAGLDAVFRLTSKRLTDWLTFADIVE